MSNHTQDVSIEAALLGACLIDANYTERKARTIEKCAAAGLVPDAFVAKKNRTIFGHLMAMRDTKIPISMPRLQEELIRTGSLEACGGNQYLATLLDSAPRLADAETTPDTTGLIEQFMTLWRGRPLHR